MRKILFLLFLCFLSNFSYSEEYQSITLKDVSRPNKETLVLFSYSKEREQESYPIEYTTYFLLKNDFKITSVFLRSLKENGFNVLEFNFNYPNNNIIKPGEELKYKNNNPLKSESKKLIWAFASDNESFLVSFGNRFLKSLYEKGGFLEDVSFSLNEPTYLLKITYLLTEDMVENFFSQEEWQEYEELMKEYALPELKIIY